MKFGIWVTTIVLALQALLAASPFIPITSQYWRTSDTQQFYAVFATAVGIHLILLTAAITLILLKESSDARDRLDAMAEAMPGATVKALTDYDFYVHFKGAAEQAEHSVWIAYLAPYPPAAVASKDRKKYDDEMIALMKRRTKVNFRRIIRYTSANRKWVADLIQNLQGRANVDIAVLKRDLPENEEMPLALSVQVIDKNKVWIVAAGAHEMKQAFRDVYIQSGDVAAAMIEYYDRIWQKSVSVLDNGRITKGGRELLDGSNEAES
jgi:hypothetical protein